jgi:hypothetical protein
MKYVTALIDEISCWGPLMHSAILFLVLVLAAAMALPTIALAQTEVDLELVLAVDVSRSMDLDELDVQREGYVAAFRHPEVIAAIRSGPLGRIAVTYVEWAGPQNQATVIPWTLIDGNEAAQAFATRLSATARGRYMWTSISAGLLYAAAAFDDNAFTSVRQVIDISGDGPNNQGSPVEPVRARVAASGITINGLPLVLKRHGPYSIPNLDVYYEDCVIGGPGAFLVPVHDMSQFSTAVRRKLLLEIVGLSARFIQASETQPPERMDCLIGEKLIQRWLSR